MSTNKVFYDGEEKSYADLIINRSGEPDKIALTNDTVQQFSDAKSYNFDSKINTCLNNVVGDFFKGTRAFCALPISLPVDKLIGSTMKDVVTNALINYLNQNQGSNIESLRKATQHTYVEGDALGNYFNDISIAPYCAQTDYNLALIAWKANNRGEALRRLGRVMHYVQDMTVPHHLSMPINVPDVCRAVVMSLRGTSNIEHESSQYKYETIAVDDYINSKTDLSYLNEYRTEITSNSAIVNSVPDELKRLKSRIVNSGCMGKVDGFSNGALQKESGLWSWAKKLWQTIKNGVENLVQEVKDKINELKNKIANFIDNARNEAADLTEEMIEENLKQHYEFSNINDDMSGSAQILVPIAIVESAKILDKFFNEVEFNKTDITPIINLLLD